MTIFSERDRELQRVVILPGPREGGESRRVQQVLRREGDVGVQAPRAFGVARCEDPGGGCCQPLGRREGGCAHGARSRVRVGQDGRQGVLRHEVVFLPFLVGVSSVVVDS